MIVSKLYATAMKQLGNKEIDWDTDTIKVMLTTSSYTPNQQTHDYKNDVTNEISGAIGYTTGGATLAGKTVTTSTLTTTYDANDVSWTTATFTFRYAIIYVDTGVASTSPLICYIDFGSDVSISTGTVTIQFNASGIFTLTVA